MLKLLVKCENYINQCKDIDNYLSYIHDSNNKN